MNTFQTVSAIEAHFATKAIVSGWVAEVVAYGAKYVYRYGATGYEIQPNIVALPPIVYPDDIADIDDDDLELDFDDDDLE